MKLENQVVSLELSKELKELSVKQESFFYWVEGVRKFNLNYILQSKKRNYTKNFFVTYSAFTVVELGEMLPDYTTLPMKVKDGWKLIYPILVNGQELIFEARTEADCRAKMLIYLIKNKII